MYLSLTRPPHRVLPRPRSRPRPPVSRRPSLLHRQALAAGTTTGAVASRPATAPIVGGPAPLRWWRELLLVALLYGAYEVSRDLVSGSMTHSISRGRWILAHERAWHIAPEHAVNTVLSHSTVLAVTASYLYSTLHYLVTPAVLIWMFRSHRGHYRLARTTLAFGTVTGLVMFTLLPTAPPRLVPGSGIRDTLASVSRFGWWGGDGSVPRGLGSATNQVAAMPSLHIGWAVWCGVLLALHARRRWVRALGIAYPIVMTLVVIGTGNHYLVDALAGVVVMAVAFGLARAAQAAVWTVRRRRAPQPIRR